MHIQSMTAMQSITITWRHRRSQTEQLGDAAALQVPLAHSYESSHLTPLPTFSWPAHKAPPTQKQPSAMQAAGI